MAIAKRPRRRFPDPGRSANRPHHDSGSELYTVESGPVELVRREEQASIEAKLKAAGAVHLRKRVDRFLAQADVARHIEDADVERRPVEAGDSGEVETLPDGSISIPIFEEEIVVTKRMVVRERLIVRKTRTTERVEVPVVLRKERIAIEADEGVKGRVRRG